MNRNHIHPASAKIRHIEQSAVIAAGNPRSEILDTSDAVEMVLASGRELVRASSSSGVCSV